MNILKFGLADNHYETYEARLQFIATYWIDQLYGLYIFVDWNEFWPGLRVLYI